MLHCGALSAWPEFRPETVSDTVWSRPTSLFIITLFIGFYHMICMAVSLQVILRFSYFIFMLSDFSEAFVFWRGRSLRWISKIFNQLNRACFSFSLLLYVWCFSVVVTEIVWSKDANWNFLRTYQCMYYVLWAILLFWKLTHLYFYGTSNEPILYPIFLCLYDDVLQIMYTMASFHNLYFVFKKVVFTYLY